MPVFTIETPAGQKLDIEANDEAGAINGAKQWHAENSNKPSTLKDTAYDVAASGASGLGKGVADLAGMPADAANAFGYYRDKYLTNPIVSALGGTPQTEEQLSKNPLAPIGSENIKTKIQGVTGDFHKPTTTAGKYAQTVGEFVPAALVAPGGVVTNSIRYGVMPGLASEAAGQATEGTKYEPYARAAGGIAGGMVNPARVITPAPSSAMRQQFVDTLRKEGVTSLTAGQRTGNEALRYLESASSSAPMAGGGAARIQGEGQQQFTNAVLKRAGAAGEATPETLQANYKRLGDQFNDLSARNSLTPDNQFINDVVGAVKDYKKVPDSQQRQIVQGYVDDIIGHVNNGSMPGPYYQEMRSRLSKQSKAYANNDPALSEALGGLRNSLDSAMGRSISPEDKALWDLSRKEYGAQKVIEKAASRAGQDTLEGNITPANLRNVVSAENRGAYARGQGQMAELARAGAGVMTPLPSSGTAERLNAFNLLNQLTAGAVPAATGRVIMNPIVQGLIGNQVMSGARSLPKNTTAQQLLTIEMLSRGLQPSGQAQ